MNVTGRARRRACADRISPRRRPVDDVATSHSGARAPPRRRATRPAPRRGRCAGAWPRASARPPGQTPCARRRASEVILAAAQRPSAAPRGGRRPTTARGTRTRRRPPRSARRVLDRPARRRPRPLDSGCEALLDAGPTAVRQRAAPGATGRPRLGHPDRVDAGAAAPVLEDALAPAPREGPADDEQEGGRGGWPRRFKRESGDIYVMRPAARARIAAGLQPVWVTAGAACKLRRTVRPVRRGTGSRWPPARRRPGLTVTLTRGGRHRPAQRTRHPGRHRHRHVRPHLGRLTASVRWRAV